MFRNMAQVLSAGITHGQRLSEKTGLQAVGGNRCYYMNAPCSWQPVTGEGHLIAQVV